MAIQIRGDMKIEIKNCGECPAFRANFAGSDFDICAIDPRKEAGWAKVDPDIIPSWCPLRQLERNRGALWKLQREQ